MRRLALASLCLAMAACQTKQSVSLHMDHSLESLVPADVVLVAGANLEAIRKSPVYQKLVSHFPVPQLEAFSRQTGVDPNKDVLQALFCSDGKRGLFIARGKFRQPDIESHLKSNGATEFNYKKYRIFGDEQNAVVFLDDSTAVVGPAARLRSLIDEPQASRGLPQPLAALLRSLPASAQIYAAFIGGVSGFDVPLPKTEMLANLGQVLQSVDSAALGIELDGGLNATARINSKTERDAKFVHDMVKGLVGFGRLNAPPNQPELLKLYDAIHVDQQQMLTVINADLAPDQIDRLLAMESKR